MIFTKIVLQMAASTYKSLAKSAVCWACFSTEVFMLSQVRVEALVYIVLIKSIFVAGGKFRKKNTCTTVVALVLILIHICIVEEMRIFSGH